MDFHYLIYMVNWWQVDWPKSPPHVHRMPYVPLLSYSPSIDLSGSCQFVALMTPEAIKPYLWLKRLTPPAFTPSGKIRGTEGDDKRLVCARRYPSYPARFPPTFSVTCDEFMLSPLPHRPRAQTTFVSLHWRQIQFRWNFIHPLVAFEGNFLHLYGLIWKIKSQLDHEKYSGLSLDEVYNSA